ncbi:epoxide hydrolase EphA [soil metagenome]
MTTVSTRRLETAPGVELVVHESGRPGDPVVLLCHGFPETAHSWRHQMGPLADADYHVLAPDQRGYSHSSAPRDVGAYRVDHLTDDLLAVLDHAGAEQAVFVGHDWGAFLVWHMGQLHPDRCRAVVAASVPWTQWPAPPTDLFRAVFTDQFFYMLYFQQVGPAEAELEADARRTMHTVLWAGSGECHHDRPVEPLPAEGTGFLDSMLHRAGGVPDGLPDWLTGDDLDTYVESFTASGFFGPVSWYRNLDANHELTSGIAPSALAMPTFFIGGTHDGVIAGRLETVEAMAATLPNHRGNVLIPGAGHWTQQEAPAEFNEALLGFLRTL